MMFRRSLPSFPDLAAFLGHLQAKGDVANITAPVDTHLELTELHRRVIGQGGPVLRVANPTVQGAPAKLPIVTNLFGTRARVAAGLGTDEAGLVALGELMAFLRSPRPPETLAEAGKLWPVARAALNARPRVVADTTRWRDDLTRLSDVPIQTCWPGDVAPLVTWGLVITRAPGPDAFSTYNLGVYRLQLVDDGRLLMRWLPMRGGAQHHRMWAKTGEPTPAAIVIGADPATILASVMPAPEGVTELAIAGIVGASRPRLVPCRTIPLHIPASADIVLEGTVSHTETLPEGPYGDHTGYYNPPEPFPVFNLSAMRVRDGAPYLTTFTGRAPDEPAVMAEALSDVFKPLLRQQLPEVLDLYLPPETCSYRVAILSIDKRYPGQARRVMMGFWSLLPQFSMTKLVIVVDGDIDIRSWSDVMWAVATRSDASRDLMTVDRTPIDHLDFAAPIEGLGGKLGIDATTKIGTETDRTWGTVMTMDKAVAARVDQRWSEFFPTTASAPRP